MMAKASKYASDRQFVRFFEEWIDGSTIHSSTQSKELSIDIVKSVSAWLLYESILVFFSRLVSYTQSSKDRTAWTKALKADVGSLYLWGECYEGGQLDIILADSDDLRHTIIELLATLGLELHNGIFIAPRIHTKWLTAQDYYQLSDLYCPKNK